MASSLKLNSGRIASCIVGRAVSRAWLMQRLSGALLMPLAMWFVWMALPELLTSSEASRAWIAKPWNTARAFLWSLLIFYHGWLGIVVILEDYIPDRYRQLCLTGARIVSLGGALIACVCILQIWWERAS